MVQARLGRLSSLYIRLALHGDGTQGIDLQMLGIRKVHPAFVQAWNAWGRDVPESEELLQTMTRRATEGHP